MDATGFSNSWTEGEISDDAWDRVDIQPVGKGCELAQNLIIRVAGPLGKRRGFWRLGPVNNQAQMGRLVPFRRTINDALMLEFGNLTVRVWQANGAALLNMGVQVSFASPYTSAQIQLLRYKQIGNVIELRISDGSAAPQALERLTDLSWQFNAKTFSNGPWLAENTDLTSTMTLTSTSGTDALDRNTNASHVTGAGAIIAGNTLTIAASKPIFAANMVGAQIRIRQNGDAVSALSWSPGTAYVGPGNNGLGQPSVGDFVTSVGNMYYASIQGVNKNGSNPPVQTQGTQSDGDNMFTYLHDGAGVIEITGFTDTQHVSGTVLRTTPIQSGVASSFWAFSAYSEAQGWPTAWPELREERLVDGATASNQDFCDLTQTAGFDPINEDFTPGSGLGTIVDTNAIRRRLGVDGGKILSFCTATYLVAFAEDAEHLIAGSVLDEPLSPAAVTVKQVSGFGSADVRPAKVWDGVCFVARGSQAVRWLAIDTQQGAVKDDFTVLAQHIAARNFAQLEWVPYPDNTLWARLGDGGPAVMTFHKEQAVRGWTSQRLAGGFIVEDEAVLPGPGGFETLWLIVSRVKGGTTQRCLWMQSQASDALFLDGAFGYTGLPVSAVAGLDDYDGETVFAMGDGVQTSNLVVAGGVIDLPTAASSIQVGFAYPIEFKSLKLNLLQGFVGGSLNKRQRIATAIVSFKGVGCQVGIDGGIPQTVSTRRPSDVPGPVVRRKVKDVSLAGDGAEDGRDPRIVITELSGYDFVLYSIKPKAMAGE